MFVGKGLRQDIRNRLPYYISDWTDAWNYRVIPSLVYVFFTNLLPAIAFSQDMFDKTNNSYGVNEILLSSTFGGVVFGLFAGQPLCIVGVTGPISIFNYTVYDLVKNRENCGFFEFMCWIGIWSFVLHSLIALLNGCALVKYVTRYSCNVFGLFINVIYIQKGIQILTRQFKESDNYSSGWFSVTLALLMVIFGVCASLAEAKLEIGNSHFRKFVTDYGTPLCVIFFTGFIHFNHSTMANGHYIQKLPIRESFKPTAESRNGQWLVRFWENISVGNVFYALPFGIVLTLLFYFDHNVSSLICQDSRFKLKKPPSFHYDFLLLGIVTFITGLLGIPFPNGLIPQAPLHTISLLQTTKNEKGKLEVEGVVEQRFTNTFQGLMTLVMMTKPFLTVLGLVPQAVLAGLFFIMAIGALAGNDIVLKIRYLLTEPKYLHKLHEKEQLENLQHLSSRKWLILFLCFDLAAFAAEFGICQGKGAIGFPAVLCFFAIVAAVLFSKVFPSSDLKLLDGPTGSRKLLEYLELS